LKVNKVATPTNQQKEFKKKKLQHRLKENKAPNKNLCLKENKTPNPKHIKMNKKENRVRNLPKHSNFTCEIKP
jgi:hypothetical protein